MTSTLSPTESLKKTVCDYKSHIAEITSFQKETVTCLEEIQKLINAGRSENLFSLPALQIPEFNFDNRLPCVLFIGSQNCGKSTLLNVFLRKNHLLPVHENPCTARLVRIVYSAKNYVTLIDSQGNRQEVSNFKNRGNLIVLKNEDRQDSEKLKTIVEVGLNHELLECGIELIDSPGRNENEALDLVVEEYVEKGIVPLIIYVVDGNNQLQLPDRKTIRQLQSKFPNVSLMFVCSKVDINPKANDYDKDDDSDDGCDTHSDEELFNKAQTKAFKVFQKLKDLDFLPSDADIGSCDLFHGISAVMVKNARREKIKNAATMSFENLELSIFEKLESSLRRESKRVLSTLLSAQEMILSCVVDKHRTLTATVSSLPDAYKRAVTNEQSVFSMILDLIVRRKTITNTIGSELEKLAIIFLKEGEEFQFMTNGKNKEALVEEFCCEMKGAILDRAFNVLTRTIKNALRRSLVQAVIQVEQITAAVGDPLISRLMQRIYANEYGQQKNHRENKDFLERCLILEGILESFRSAVNTVLRNEISRQLEEFDLQEVGSRVQRPQDSSWRRKVVQTLLSKIDCQLLTKQVIETCNEALSSKHKQFTQDVRDYRSLHEVLSAAGVESTIKRLRSDYVPQVAELAVKGHALQYVIERRGPPELGEELTDTAHGKVYSCFSPLWCADRECCVVKVVTKSAVGSEVWNQTMRDCLHTLDIVSKLGECSPYLLQLNGWFFPEHDQLYIVMEGAQEDLLTALRRGMSWEKRMGVAVDVAKGVSAIHKVNYVYKDLKPQNVMLSADGTAKVNLCKPEKPLEMTKLGAPFHISPKMLREYDKHYYGSCSFDIYAFGSLLWVLCEGSGHTRPNVYSHCYDIETMKNAVCVQGIRPERPPETPDALWELMSSCWSDSKQMTMGTVLDQLLSIQSKPFNQELNE